jgi:hypothetical protein
MEEYYKFRIEKNVDSWDDVVRLFDDASIYQTKAYGEIMWGKGNIEYALLYKNELLVSATIVRLIKIGLLPICLAYIYYGPMWKRNGLDARPENLKKMLHCLRDAYYTKRHFPVWVRPNIYDHEKCSETQFIEEKYRKIKGIVPHKSILLPLKPSLEDIRKGLRKNWRNHLNKSEKNGISIIKDNSTKSFMVLRSLYFEMHNRKHFHRFIDIDRFGRILELLPNDLKLKIMVSYSENKPVSAIFWSQIGKISETIFSATGNSGTKLGSSYLLRWELVKILYEDGIAFLDQGGADKKVNSGGYDFKMGMGGYECMTLGVYQATGNIILQTVSKVIETIMLISRKISK